jgi:hypothetical protein
MMMKDDVGRLGSADQALSPSGTEPPKGVSSADAVTILGAGPPRPSKVPCGSCPYRRDVPAGIWEAHEYAKLPPYDNETWAQPPVLFYCHQNDGHLCAGWVGCHDTDHLLAMRFHRVHPDTFDYVSPVPLFASGADAAAHGLAGVAAPDRRDRAAIQKLAIKRADAPNPSGGQP